jgi:HK97 family phage major capsid protein
VSADAGRRVKRALDGDSSLLVTRSVTLDDIEIPRRAKGGDGRTVVAYAAVWMQPAEIVDVDGHYREQAARDSMDKSVSQRAGQIFCIYNHGKTLHGTPSERHSVPLGKPLEIRPDRTGLLTVTRYGRAPESEQILEAIIDGSLTGMSYTGVYLRSDPELGMYGQYGPDVRGELPLVTRLEIALIEYGPTPIPAYEQAAVVGVRNRRSAVVDEPEVEPAQQERPVITLAPAGPARTDPPADEPDEPAAVPVEHEPAAQSRTGSSGSTSTSGRTSAPEGTEPAEPHPHPATIRTRSTNMPDTDRETMTVEERVARQSEIRSRFAELDTEYAGAELPDDARGEWNGLQQEMVRHERAIADASTRADYLRYINDTHPEATERVDNTRAGYGQGTGPGAPGGGYGRSGPALHTRDNIYDLASIRNRARHIDEVPVLYREAAMRAVEQGRFPGATGQRGAPTREDAQTRVSTLLDTIDDEHGSLARRILITGSPLYERAFGKMLGMQSTAGLSAEESRALSLGTDAAGGYAVPFQLDPTVILTNNGVVNPLRAISRVETITGKEWDGVSSAGVVVTRGTEGQELGTGDPALAQPAVRTSRVQGFIPFSIELDVSWGALRTQMTSLLQDAKDVEEATAFALGNGTAPNPSGVVSTLGTASYVQTAGSGVLAAGDVYLLENALAPRFISNASVVASKTIFNKFRALFQAQASAAGDPFARPSQGMGAEFNGYPKYELSTMSAASGTGALVMLQGDFSRFLIVDRVGMGIELIPHLFGATNRYPTGQRGVLAIWFNSSKILADNAFRLLQVKST